MSVDLREQVQHVKDIENAILQISKAIAELRSGRLTDDAIVILLKNMCGKEVKAAHIREVINNLGRLADHYLKPEDEQQSQRKGKSK